MTEHLLYDNEPKAAPKTKLVAAIVIGAAAGFTFTIVLVALHGFFHH